MTSKQLKKGRKLGLGIAYSGVMSDLKHLGQGAFGALPLLLAWQGACLFPPPVDQAGSGNNLPPRILPLTLVPSPSEQPVLSKRECLTQFGASVEDPDDEVLYWKVFVDYWAGPEHQRSEVRVAAPGTIGDPVAIDFTTDPGDFAVDDTIAHSVELFLADRPFVDDGGLSGGRELVETSNDPQDQGQVDRFIWSFSFDESLAQCP